MLRIDKALSQKIIPWLAPVIIAVFVLFIINHSFFQLAVISSSDMQSTYSKGDVVLLNKCSSVYKKNEVLAFNFYTEDSTAAKPILLIQRCVAEPGDTIELMNGFVYINNDEDKFIPELKHNYHLKAKLKLDKSFLTQYNLTEGGVISDELDYSYSLTQSQADSLSKDSVFVALERTIEKANLHDQLIFPNDSVYKWNKHNYGALYIPKKGDTLNIDSTNISLYKQLISVYEKNDLVVRGDSVLINGKLTKTYTVKQNYYFLLGDNRDNALDSRYFGFLPEENLVGKVVCIVKKQKR